MTARFFTVGELLEAAKLPQPTCYIAPYTDLRDETLYRHEVSGVVKTGATWKHGNAVVENYIRKYGEQIIHRDTGSVCEVKGCRS